MNGSENGVALDVGACSRRLELEDGDAVAGGDAQRLAGAARGLAVGGTGTEFENPVPAHDAAPSELSGYQASSNASGCAASNSAMRHG
ncbi:MULTISPECIES: hypothetical protein [Novosphingobium]|uniref:hypothetical protein n=1 Tax=Novosphingobium TaxID=165696 RepID=UPI0012E07273|nr:MULTISPECIES: hypothetical protein [Novosphingobium]QOV96096.1 hypothetical protein IM701_18915 [Novosphingobium sp. ES2-1]